MNQKMRKILSFVLVLCMLLTNASMVAFAAEGDAESTTTNGTYENGHWVEGGTGSVTHTVDKTKVTLSKTAAPVAGQDNVFEITLKVSTSTTTTTYTDGGAVVLVIDTSSSMKSCAECGGRDYHNNGCERSGSVTTEQSRLYAAKGAASTFLSNYAGSDPVAARMLAIVTFDGSYRTNLKWVNVAGGSGNNSYDTARSTIWGLNYATGTNMEGGLDEALTLVKDSAVSSFSSKNVVLLSDGAPTARIGNSNVMAENQQDCEAAAAKATAVKNAGAKLYTVCFGAQNDTAYGSLKVGTFLSRDVASSGCAYNADTTSELYSAFKAISNSITSGLSGSGWTATDPMAENISVVGGTSSNFSSTDGTNYTWKLEKPETVTNGNTTTYTYTYKYTVELDVQGQSFEEGKFFPTNDPTYLNIDGQQYAFPVPGVKGELPRTDISVTKVWDDAENQDGIRAESVTVQLKNEEGTVIGEAVELNAANGWTYTWDGDTYDLIAQSKGLYHVYTVEELNVPEEYVASYPNEPGNFALVVKNSHKVAKKDITVTKVWNDEDNQDGKRPESITVHLLADDVKCDSATLTAEGGWKHTFENLDKNANGKAINYTVTEDLVPNYTTEIEGYVVTNTHEVEKTEVKVTKIWNDANNQDNKRPQIVTFELYADGESTGETITLSGSGNEWKGQFNDLDKYANGKEIVYTVKEQTVPGGYTASYSDDKLTVTNTHDIETTSISGTKFWKDAYNQDGKRPESITIYLKADGEKINSVEVKPDANGDWKWTFSDLPVYKEGAVGQEINYTFAEETVEGYSTEINGNNITNSYTPEKTSVTVTKVWDDANNQDGIRPNDITVKLLADGVDTGKELDLSSGNNWTGSFTGLAMYKNGGTAIEYNVAEISVPGYKTAISGNQTEGYTITNTHVTETVEVSGKKTWDDNNNQDGARPESITINLMNGTEVVATKTVTGPDWNWSFTNLPKYENGGKLIQYKVTEEAVKDYSTTYDGNNVINKYTPKETSVTVTKTWLDNYDQDGIRPNEIKVVLVADDVATENTLTLSEGNDWTGSFTGLPMYRDGGVEIIYTVKEVAVEGYTTVISGDQATGYTITNSHTPETTSVSGSKTWNDNNNQDGMRPESITINLVKNGEVFKTVTVTEEDNWSWSFNDLPKHENKGKLITYAITEEKVEEYTTELNGYDVINTHDPEKTSFTVLKAWADSNNQDGIRPNDITVELLADGEKTGKTLVLSSGNGWTGSFTDLDKYANGEEIEYNVAEVAVEGYKTVITGDQEAGFTITNSHTPATIELSGTKTWVDNNNQDGFRPESITINLLADGEKIDPITVTAEDEWSWTVKNLPKFRDQGTEIVYSFTEDAVADYSTEYKYDEETGIYTVINTHTPEQTSVTVTKAWEDNDDQDGIRPEEITVILWANGQETDEQLVLNEENNWTGSFTALDKYAEGKEIVYYVEELEIEGYETIIAGNQTEGYRITNSHTPEVIEISGSKTWDDANNQDGARPESITVNLMANGQLVKTATVTEAEDWSYSFENLPKFANGEEIIYAITENAVDGYTTTYDGYNIINSYTPLETSVTVTKAWADSDDEDGLRPKKITILLYANGEKVDEKLVLTADDNWSGSFVGLPKYANGVEIVYTIGEVSVEGYNTVIRGNMTSGFVVTNSHTVIPQTGDERTPILWILMLLGSVAVVGYMGYDFKKRRMAK